MDQSRGDMLPLTQKDLAYLHDQMSWELLATKKAYQYAHQTMEPECAKLMHQIGEKHQRNLERLLGHLQQHVDQLIQANLGAAQQEVAQAGGQMNQAGGQMNQASGQSMQANIPLGQIGQEMQSHQGGYI